ncbi:MAG: NAD(P)-dependent oxidoreductase [Acidobacteriota bacterium]
MTSTQPTLIVTGASGIVGRNFLRAIRDRFAIYAIARRPQKRVRVANHSNVRWIQVDIGDPEALNRAVGEVERQGGADYLIHLAAHYDFENVERPEYEHTNVRGTRNVLEQAKRLAVRHFVFASSVAACEFPAPGETIDESTPPDAEFPYARSKKVGEELVREYSQWLRCSIVRLAAVFSDWCEYAPLYVFLDTWLSHRWNARILGGKGRSAVPYIHTRDVNRMFETLLERTDDLPRCGVYIASPDGASTHRDLFELATRFRLGSAVKPILMPKPLATLGVWGRDLLGRMIGHRPFERPWMLDYLDRSLTVDASATRAKLGWEPTPRLHVLRRILFLIENMRSNPQEWTLKNEAGLMRQPARPSLAIHNAMVEAKEAIVDSIAAYLGSPVRQDRFPHFQSMSARELRWYARIVYELLLAAVRTGDRTLLLVYIQHLARRRFVAGFPPSEVCEALLSIDKIIVEQLMLRPEMQPFMDPARESLSLSTAVAIDEVQDAFDAFVAAGVESNSRAEALSTSGEEIERLVDELNSFYRPPLEESRSQFAD